jgi:hypothetical protein
VKINILFLVCILFFGIISCAKILKSGVPNKVGEEIILDDNVFIEKQEMEKNYYSWEINFLFPYNSEYFINKTMELSDSFINSGYENVVNYHRDIKTYLQEIEYEYMIWQEWKEGFARYVENLIRKELELQLNTNVLKQPFDRVHFYEIGNKYIEILVRNDKDLNVNIVKLFNKMNISE